MPRRRFYQGGGKAVSFYAESGVYDRLKELLEAKGTTVSEELNRFMRKRLAELEGAEASVCSPAEYEALKHEYLRLVEEGKKLNRKVAGNPHYRELLELAVKIGLEAKDFSNVADITPKLLAEWKGPLPAAHNFITLLEISSRTAVVEKKLTEIRLQRRTTPCQS